MAEYPDLSKPLNPENYPDLSLPMDQLDLSPEVEQAAQNHAPLSTSENLELMANRQGQGEKFVNPYYQGQEYSEPAMMEGFKNLSPEEQKERLSFSNLMPENMTGEGRNLPAGTYQNPLVRSILSSIASLGVPELRGGGLASRYLFNPLINAAGRIGAGTGANVLTALPKLNEGASLKQLATDALKGNALLEIPNIALRTPGYIGEMAYPNRLARQTMNEIEQDYNHALQRQEQAYAPTHVYDNTPVTNQNPAIYLNLDPRDRRRLTTNSRRALEDFEADPNYRNLHRFQYTLGHDIAATANSSNKINTHQSLIAMRDIARQRSRQFLGNQSTEALNAYDLGTHITQHEVSPFETTESIKKIAEGRATARSPIQVRQALRTGMEKKRSGRGQNVVPTIPENHILRHHHDRLNNAINFGMATRYGVPAVAGALGAYALHPSLGGALGGLGAGAVGAGLGHLGVPGLATVLTNPLMEQFFSRYISPLYYGGGRAAMGNALAR